jgi:ABC-type polysaccharide/polyol phosphate export permease
MKAKYAGSGLGILWAVMTPLIQILIFWVVFSAIMKARPYADTKMPYVYFLFSSFFFWLAFSEGLSRAANAIVDHAEMVKKVSFPHIVLPVTVTFSSYISNMIGFLLFIIIYSIVVAFSPIYILIIPVLFFQVLFSLGLGMLLSALLPYVRDIGQILSHVLQGTFFLSPIIYSLEFVPEKLRPFFFLNPMTYFASSYHKIILLNEVPPLFYIVIIISLSTGSFICGYLFYKKLKEGFSDVL